jgi:hypothetical protein
MEVSRKNFKMIRQDDTDPDTSWIGEYSNSPGDNAIDRQERGDTGRNEFRYCNITMSAEETGNSDSVEQDYQRMEAIARGDVWFIGIAAEVTLNIPSGRAGESILQKIKSPGVWGIKSDNNDDYFESVYADECVTLASMLDEMGITVVD